MEEKQRSRQGLLRPILLLAVVIGMVVIAHFLGLGEKLGKLHLWIQTLGPWGPIAFIGIYVLATVAALPGAVITAIAGALFGSVWGVVIVSIASTIGASLAFLIARYFARESISRWLAANEKFRRLDDMTERHGAIIVAVVRLIPLFPFDLLNYGFGLTRIPFWTYVFWSWLCMLPGTILYVVGADALAKSAASGEVPWLLIVIVIAVAFILFLLGRHLYKIMKAKGEDLKKD
ncbi:MAG: TVP38/TMEM64 family protein [Syntrophales bacterium]|nr:TVP38/TMEM64 family protein [Syntrophales bacterium]